MAKMPDSITVKVRIVDPDIVAWLADVLHWPFDTAVCGIPIRYVRPVAERYCFYHDNHTESVDECEQMIWADLMAHNCDEFEWSP